jgi:pimeloyl-ACP methyl ester carboxylesterase
VIQPKTSYTRNGDVNIAYQVIGDGPLDLLFIPAFVSHLDLYWTEPETAAFFRRLASFSRLILFDKRGTGLSDPVSEVATLEERMEDARAVLDAVGSQRAALFGLSEGGPMSLLFAATYPERTTALIMFGSFAKLIPTPHYLWELREDFYEGLARFTDALENHWGEGRTLALFMPSIAGDANVQRMLGLFERAAASPAMVCALQQFNTEIDVTHILPLIGVPTLVLHRTDDLVTVELGRYVADHVPGARFVELAGNDHVPWLGGSDAVVDEVEQFLTGARHAAEPDRVLATVLFTDIAGSTERAAELGDDRWSALLDNHNELVRRQLGIFRGREVKTLGDGFLATFDGPARAIRCACAIREDVGSLGIGMRRRAHRRVRGDGRGHRRYGSAYRRARRRQGGTRGGTRVQRGARPGRWLEDRVRRPRYPRAQGRARGMAAARGRWGPRRRRTEGGEGSGRPARSQRDIGRERRPHSVAPRAPRAGRSEAHVTRVVRQGAPPGGASHRSEMSPSRGVPPI